MRNALLATCLTTALFAAAGPALAITATVPGEPAVSVTVPSGFAASDSDHGIEIKTPDEEVMVWCETFKPDEAASMKGEHQAYWKDQGVKLGEPDVSEDDGAARVQVETYTKATWKGDPTIVQYMFIDGHFASKELILMTVWASPEDYVQHKDDILAMLKSVTAK